jgi:hypothetical protein
MLVPKLFRNKVEQIEVLQNFSGTKGIKQRCFKLFRSNEEQTEQFQSYSGTKRNKQRYSKAIQEQRRTTQIILILFRNKVEQTKLFQNLSRLKWNKANKSKKDRKLTKKITLHKLDTIGIPVLDCDLERNLHPGSVYRRVQKF